MKLKIILSIGIVMACLMSALAQAQEREIKLKDGTVLQGEVVSKEGDIYKISTNTLGFISIKDQDIVSMAESQPVQQSNVIHDAEEMKQAIMGDQQTMSSVQALAQDPKVVEMFEDKALRNAILKQDMGYLKNNEKFTDLMHSPEMEKIIKDLKDRVTVSKEEK